MKTKEELNALKAEYESLVSKMKELDENELKEVTGGAPDAYDFRGAYHPEQLYNPCKQSSEDDTTNVNNKISFNPEDIHIVL